ncbi:MAG: ergothioneine biosynthesis protein EgtB [Microcoleus vaginatus WJT46-NPBG5]|nr:ergothioneine biosynthesis protein EgtB [Microcoleus vaginatus WJT46-NPBG5]
MISTSINCRDTIRNALQQCRTGTLQLFEGMDDATFRRQAHPEFSPVGWHLGHIAYIEALWLLQRSAGLPPAYPEYHQLFAADGLPKAKRVQLPNLPEVRQYLNAVREKVFAYLETAPLEKQERLWRFIIQHESQHCETIAFVLQLAAANAGTELKKSFNPRMPASHIQALEIPPTPLKKEDYDLVLSEMIQIPAGEFEQGNDSADAMDNEQPLHRRYLETYWIDRYPVTCRQYRQFMAADGYQNSAYWSNAGWEWLQANPVIQPLYWIDDPTYDNHPVCGVSWYEAEAYAKFAGKRLPTEAEWEKAAGWDALTTSRRTYPWGETQPNASRCNHQLVKDTTQEDAPIQNRTMPVDAYPAGVSAYGCYDMLGNVWEWTATWFDGYEGFKLYPYAGYSQAYFDGEHRVLKGGSWATRPWAMRCSFRNWYYPSVRQILAGFRCASRVNLQS